MRNYSEPWFDLGEITAAFKGLCEALGISNVDVKPTLSLLGQQIVSVASSIGLSLNPTGDLGQTAINLQSLIDFCLESRLVEYNDLHKIVDKELTQLPPSPFVDYFTGELKVPLRKG